MTDILASCSYCGPPSSALEHAGLDVGRGADAGPPVFRSAEDLTRDRPNKKRAACINVQEANNQIRLGDLSQRTPSTLTPHSADSTRDHVCLCTPAPKVPRPRNAFILYRQCYQAEVKAQHRELANPEISKIIGERWREEPEEEKKKWRSLAEEEKQQHRRQYPGYRYQPRRGGRGSGGRVPSISGEDSGRCPKCGGRYISTPRTPFSRTPTPTPTLTARPTEYGLPHQVLCASHPEETQQDRIVTRHENTSKGSGYWPSPRPSTSADDEAVTPMEAKRYCQDTASRDSSFPGFTGFGWNDGSGRHRQPVPLPGIYTSHAEWHATPSLFSGASGVTAGLVYGGAINPLPGPSDLIRAVSAGRYDAMGPPLRPSFSTYPHTHDMVGGSAVGFGESLRLPPLQPRRLPTSSPDEPSNKRGSLSGESLTASIDAVVQGMSIVRKVETLSRVGHSLLPPRRSSGQLETRGPIIAIEGAHPQLLRLVESIVQKALAASCDCAIRTWSSEDMVAQADCAGNSSEIGIPGSLPSRKVLVAYLRIILEWHARSTDMVEYVSSPPALSDRVCYAPDTLGCLGDNTGGSSTNQVESAARRAALPRVLPVALVTGGFSLTLSDRFALAMPMGGDSYAAEEHWQWMATLWRGVVGADLLVCVRAAGTEERGGNPSVEMIPRTAGEPAGPAIMVVRVSKPDVGDVEVVDDTTTRRLVFEIVEWMRASRFPAGAAP